MKKIIAVLFAAIFVQSAFAQTNENLINLSKDILYGKNQKVDFIRLKDNIQVSLSEAETFINDQILGGGINKVVLFKSEEDVFGFQHLKFKISVNGITYANKIINAHFKNGQLISLNGDLQISSSQVPVFQMTESAALQFALNKIGAQKYKWENKEEELQMRQVFNQPNFTYYPSATKVIFEKEGRFYSAYQFNIYAETPLYRANVFVDAKSGTILDEQNLICTADVPATAVTKYSGTRNITCDQNGSIYRLRETQRGLGIETYNIKNTSNYGASVDFTNTTTSWTTTGFDQGAHDAHWGAEMTYDYYLSQHNRNSINNAGFKLVSYVHYQNNYQNAFWDGQRMTYGDGVNGKLFTTLDICGHEITHGLTSNTGNLTYANESGALNESFSDIFGACIENYARPTNWNWKIAEDLYTNASGFRNMSNPNLFGDPDCYMGTNYYTGTQDNGGVHTNSGVSNFWFYLLTTGGSGTNDLGNAYSVSGIGITNAAKIAFRALSFYFVPSTNFISARNLSIQAAKDLFGDCSNEVEQTTRAWFAVGVGANYSPSNLGVNFTSNGTNFCSIPAAVNFTNKTSNGITYTWHFGDGATATSTNAAHTYTAAGVYPIKLVAVGCNNAADSMVKTAYIKVNGPISNPIVNDGDACAKNSATLNASGTGTIKWYDNQFGGTLLGIGNTFITPTLNASATYYAENSVTLAPSFGGMPSNTGGGYLNNGTNYTIFDVTQFCTLNSVVVYAQTVGAREIQLRSSANVILNTTTATLSIGANTVNLNFNLSPGTNYRLALGVTSPSSLYRSTSGVNYPYNVGGCVNITNSSAGLSSYYFFYNWSVSEYDCASGRLPVTANVNPLPQVSISGTSTLVCLDDIGPITGEPLGGTFYANNANVGSVFNASTAGLGNSYVIYSYTDANGCTDSSSVELQVQECTGISKNNFTNQLVLFPNPAKNSVHVSCSEMLPHSSLSISDASGRLVLEMPINSYETEVNVSNLSNGLYIVSIKSENSILKTIKLIKE